MIRVALTMRRKFRESFSCGDGRFFTDTFKAELDIVFGLVKGHDSLDIEIYDDGLKRWLHRFPPLCNCLDNSMVSSDAAAPSISMDVLLRYYPEVSAEFNRHEIERRSFVALELFVDHFLREGSVLAKLGFEDPREEELFTDFHLRDIRCRYSSMLDDLVRLDTIISDLDETLLATYNPVRPHVLDKQCSSRQDPQDLVIKGRCRSDLRGAIAQRDFTKVAKVLASASGVVDTRDLCHAIEHYDSAVFRLLIEHGPQMNANDAWTNPMYAAANAGNLNAIQQLLDYGANIEGTNSLGDKRPLTGAVIGGHLEIVRYLVEVHGAKIDRGRDISLLSHAFKNGHKEIFEYLLGTAAGSPHQNCGGKPSTWQWPTPSWKSSTSSPRSTPLLKSVDVPEDRNSHEILRPEISKHTWDLLFSIGSSPMYVEVVRFLVNSHVDIGSIRKDSPLYYATVKGQLDRVNSLLQRATSLPTADVVLLIWCAAENGHLHVVDFLLGYDPEIYSTLLSLMTHLATTSANDGAIFRLNELRVDLNQLADKRPMSTSFPFLWCNSSPCSYCDAEDAATPTADLRKSFCPVLFRCCHWNLIDALERYNAKITNVEACPAVAAIRDQERRTTARLTVRRLLEQVKSSREEVLSAGGRQDASVHLKRFVGRVGTAKSIWKCGTRAIRNIVKGYMPSSLPEVVSVLQVADAMRLAVPASNLAYSKKE